MNIHGYLFEAFLKCPTKCYLRSLGEAGTGNGYAEWLRTCAESYRIEAAQRLGKSVPEAEIEAAPIAARNVETAKRRLAVDGQAQITVLSVPTGQDGGQGGSQELASPQHAVQRVPSESRGKPARFVPIRFVFTNKLGKDDRLQLARDALVLCERIGGEFSFGKIMHGDNYAMLKVRLLPLLGEVRNLTAKMGTLLSSSSPPDLVLNRHCAECEFRDRCRQKALEKDDLSLLAGMTEKERKKLHGKGIFAVRQLSYTFRPRRRPKQLRAKQEKYHHSLKALAIRERKIHIVGVPKLKIDGTLVFFDVEGLPDRDFYYLIGVRIITGESVVQHSLWADEPGDEKTIWNQLLDILAGVENPVLVHYGAFETIFLKRMSERYGGPREGSTAAHAIRFTVNLLSVIFARIYFPTYSNGLKEVAGWFDFKWSESSSPGAQTIRWRHEWEETGEATHKQRLVTYNAEDCAALELVAAKVLRLVECCPGSDSSPASDVVDTTQLKREHPYGFKRNTFALPVLESINKAAYWDYQRERIYVRSNKSVRHAMRRASSAKKTLVPNKIVDCPRPPSCPECGSPDHFGHGKMTKTVIDLKFMRHGVTRQVVRFRFHRYKCNACGATFQPDQTLWTRGKFGTGLIAYALYQNIFLRLTQEGVDRSLNKLFGLNLPWGATHSFKAKAARVYRDTYQSLLQRLCTGSLLHIDETKISVRDNVGFVWVLASMEEVAYVYRESREGEVLHELLKDFTGVLVSDFYSAYDSVNCPQQKCLIHLIRDLNDDVLKHPFDDGLKQLLAGFADLLKPIVETIDRFGLKRRFLRKHLSAVDRFYRDLARMRLSSEPASRCKKRIEKNRNTLFTFLRHDGVPWNNNNAEHAVKAFATLRRVIQGVTSQNGLNDYLVLLSICETCKYRGLDFLDFLRSGEKDLETFAQKRATRRGSVLIPLL